MKWGHPWHGWIVKGQLLTPAGPRPVAAAAYPSWTVVPNNVRAVRRHDGLTGDAFLVDFGAPLVETSAPELALGMKWANDLVLFGERKFIYPGSTACLERNGWLYGAPSGHVWYMRVFVVYPATLAPGSDSMPVRVIVTAQPFGRIGAPYVAPVTVLDQQHVLSGFHLGNTFGSLDMIVAPWELRWADEYVDGANVIWPAIIGFIGAYASNNGLPRSQTPNQFSRRLPLSTSKSGDVALVEIGSGVRHWIEEVLRLDISESASGSAPVVALSLAWGIDVCAPLWVERSQDYIGMEAAYNPVTGAVVRDSGPALLYDSGCLNSQITTEGQGLLFNYVTGQSSTLTSGPFDDKTPSFNTPVAAAWNPRTGESHALFGPSTARSDAPLPDLRCGYV